MIEKLLNNRAFVVAGTGLIAAPVLACAGIVLWGYEKKQTSPKT